MKKIEQLSFSFGNVSNINEVVETGVDDLSSEISKLENAIYDLENKFSSINIENIRNYTLIKFRLKFLISRLRDLHKFILLP